MNNYKVLGRVGQGAHGYVLKGINNATDRVVALKKLIVKTLDEGIPKNIMREVTALRVLNSEHVCQFVTFNFIQKCAKFF